MCALVSMYNSVHKAHIERIRVPRALTVYTLTPTIKPNTH